MKDLNISFATFFGKSPEKMQQRFDFIKTDSSPSDCTKKEKSHKFRNSIKFQT